jgi:DNA polymerase
MKIKKLYQIVMKNLKQIRSCRKCNLCKNQAPLLDKKSKAEIFWVGLSAVKVDNVENETPLSINTNSGKLIAEIENNNNHLKFYKTNLVKCLPLDKDKIRYPKVNEMECCIKNLQLEINETKPKIIFLLGKLVSDFITKFENLIFPELDNKFNYKFINHNNIFYIPIHHPSYILVYKRKFIAKYFDSISKLLNNLILIN